MGTATAEPTKRDYRSEREKQVDADVRRWCENHVVEVRLEQGVYRHYFCHTPTTSNMAFAVITTPGRLMIAGDCGDMVFERVYDMFAWAPSSIRDIDYFAGKAWSCCKTKEYDAKSGRDALKRWYEMKVEGATPEERRKHDRISRQLMRHVDDGEHELTLAFHESDWCHGDYPDFKTWSHEYLRVRACGMWFFRWLKANRPNIPLVAAPWPAPDYMI